MGRPEMSPGYSNVAEQREYKLRLLGTGAADPVKEIGDGMSVVRTGVGVFRITWSFDPKNFIGLDWGFGSAIGTDVKGYTLTRKVFDTTNGIYTLDVFLWDNANAAVELAAAQYLDLTITFKETKV
jgi:hypothetical protein